MCGVMGIGGRGRVKCSFRNWVQTPRAKWSLSGFYHSPQVGHLITKQQREKQKKQVNLLWLSEALKAVN